MRVNKPSADTVGRRSVLLLYWAEYCSWSTWRVCLLPFPLIIWTLLGGDSAVSDKYNRLNYRTIYLAVGHFTWTDEQISSQLGTAVITHFHVFRAGSVNLVETFQWYLCSTRKARGWTGPTGSGCMQARAVRTLRSLTNKTQVHNKKNVSTGKRGKTDLLSLNRKYYHIKWGLKINSVPIVIIHARA